VFANTSDVEWHQSEARWYLCFKGRDSRNNEKFKVRFLVVTASLTPLLGLNATEKMKLLTIHKENFVNVVEDVKSDLIDKYPDVFNESLGMLPGKVHLQVDPNSKPVALPVRKIGTLRYGKARL